MSYQRVHEPVCFDSLQKYFWFQDHFLGDQIQDEWGTYFEAGGAAAVVDGVTGGIIRLTTHSDLNDLCLLY